jgi:excisionase family DNA binding protein
MKQPGLPDLNRPQLLTVEQVATVLQVSTRHVENLIAQGKIRKVPNLGRSVRIAPTDVLAFISAAQTSAVVA